MVDILTVDQIQMDQWLYDPLEAMSRERGPYTIDDMEKYIDDHALELYNGWLVWQELGHIRERVVVGTIGMMFDLSARRMGFGQALPDGTECCLDQWNDFIPDASLVSWMRLEADVVEHGPNGRHILTKPPELIVESRPTANARNGSAEKRKKYFAHGALIIWDVSEKDKFIDVYRIESPEKRQRFAIGDLIDCEPILPGWRRKIADIFAKYVSAETVIGEVADELREEGGETVRIAMVRNMLQQNLAMDMIAAVSGLDIAQIEAIQSQLDYES